MRQNEIRIGYCYKCDRQGKQVEFRLLAVHLIKTGVTKKVYDCKNLATGRTFKFQNGTQDFCKRCTPLTNPKTLKTSLKETLKSKPKQENQPPHLIIEALAGTGKTTTLIEGLKILRGGTSKFLPSPQQEAIWSSMLLSRGAKTVCFVAFTKTIADELKERVPDNCEAMTMHSMGARSVRNALGSLKLNQYRVRDIIAELLDKDVWELGRQEPELLKATEKLVSLCKMNLSWVPCQEVAETDTIKSACETQATETLLELALHYDVELNGNQERVFDLVPRVLERCKDTTQDDCMDFDDMIWLSVVLDLHVICYDLLLVDESQDLNRCQQALAKRAGRRLILCGDSHQAIYGFAGADSESMKRLAKDLGETEQGCQTLPLTVTRRCGRAIVKEAQKYVPEFEAHETCCDGAVATLRYQILESDEECRNSPDGCHFFNGVYGQNKESNCIRCGCVLAEPMCYHGFVSVGDMVLCRVNAPLVSECFKFLRQGRKAQIQGRDVGAGLVSTINKMKTDNIVELASDLSNWLHLETEKENKSRNPSESRLIALQDRYDCILCFMEGAQTVPEVVNNINAIFTDSKHGEGIKLSSVHKAKGLEADRVFLLQPEGSTIPHPMAKTKWQREQEMNLLFVAITRARKELVYVS